MSKPSGLYPHSPDPALQPTAGTVRPGAWRRKGVELCSSVGRSSAVPSRSRGGEKKGADPSLWSRGADLRAGRQGHRGAGEITGTYQNRGEKGERERERGEERGRQQNRLGDRSHFRHK